MEEQVAFKNVIFNDEGILFLKKRGNVFVNVDDIKRMVYTRPTLWNFIAIAIGAMGAYPQRFIVYLKKKINNKKMYYVLIKYKEFYRLPDWVLSNVEIE